MFFEVYMFSAMFMHIIISSSYSSSYCHTFTMIPLVEGFYFSTKAFLQIDFLMFNNCSHLIHEVLLSRWPTLPCVVTSLLNWLFPDIVPLPQRHGFASPILIITLAFSHVTWSFFPHSLPPCVQVASKQFEKIFKLVLPNKFIKAMFGFRKFKRKNKEKKIEKKLKRKKKWKKIKNRLKVNKLFLYAFSNSFNLSFFYYIKIK